MKSFLYFKYTYLQDKRLMKFQKDWGKEFGKKVIYRNNQIILLKLS